MCIHIGSEPGKGPGANGTKTPALTSDPGIVAERRAGMRGGEYIRPRLGIVQAFEEDVAKENGPGRKSKKPGPC